MLPRNALPVLVVAASQDEAEKLNSTLRNAGHAVRPLWASSIADAEKSVRQQKPDLILCSTSVAAAPFPDVVKLRDMNLSNVPIIAISARIEPAIVAELINTGARDMVSMDQIEHLQAVVSREMEVLQLARELEQASITLKEYEQRINLVVKESKDAISYVHDGIVLSANPAFLELFGYQNNAEIEGTPILELFEAGSQAALKDALRQIAKGQIIETLETQGLSTKGKTFKTILDFAQTEVDGESAIEIAIRNDSSAKTAEVQARAREQVHKLHSKAQEHAQQVQTQAQQQVAQAQTQAQNQIEELQQKLAASVQQLAMVRNLDMLTGLVNRVHFIELLKQELPKEHKDAVHMLLYIKPDKFSAIAEKVGVLASDGIIKGFADMIRGSIGKQDIAARFGGTLFAVILKRPKLKDITEWADKLRSTAASRIFESAGKSTSLTCSIGYLELDDQHKDPERLLADAEETLQKAGQGNGNKVAGWTPPIVDAQGRVTDAEWKRRLTEALMHNRFMLVYQPIASLTGDSNDVYDILVRMRGEKNEEIAPKDFFPAAERTGMIIGIDRWIMENAVKLLCERLKAGTQATFFLRVSDQSLTDKSLLAWIEKLMVAATPSIPASHLVFEVAEKSAEKYITDTRAFAEGVRKLHCGFALEHFGVGHDPMHTLELVGNVDYMKIDGVITAALANDDKKREAVQSYVEKATALKIHTVAERVEKPETMAVLYQLGIEFIQGNYVQEPEVVMADQQPQRTPAAH
ncbi:MAG TPA: EAL domain-containing protein [Gammaproteobacteria bacterium]|nr:EAL domain-containing protein [Gammaproteobacteria bacterium]